MPAPIRVLLLALLAVLPVVALVPPAAADSIAEKRAEAQRVADELEQLQDRVSVLAEQHHQAQSRLDELERQVADNQVALERTTQQEDQARLRLQDWAVRAYVNVDADSGLVSILSSDGSDLGQRVGYVDAALRRDRRVIDDLRAAEEDARVSRDALATARDEAAAVESEMEGQTAEADAAVDQQTQLLARVQGELATLVAEEQQRRADEEARRARAEAQAAAARAVPPAVPSRPSSGGGGGGGGGAARPTPQPLAPLPPVNGRVGEVIAAAQSQLGVPYRYAGTSPSEGFDCSGLVVWAYRQIGVSLPRSSFAQWDALPAVPIDQLQPGDLVFFYPDVHHVGLYVGNGQMIHAPHTGDVVKYASVWRDNLTGARRPIG